MVPVLVCLPEVPNPRISGGYGRNVAIVRALRRLGCETTILALTSHRDDGTSELLRREGIEVVALDRDGIPVDTVLRRGFEVVFVTYYELAEQLLPHVYAHARGAKVVIDSVDLHYLRALRQGEIEKDPAAKIRSDGIRRRELETYRVADVLLTVSEQEQQTLADLVPGVPVGVVPSVHEVVEDAPGPEQRSGALFVGAYNFPPNRDAARHLCAEIMPRLRRLGYGDRVELIGPYLDDELQALAREAGVEPVGYVAELASLYAERQVFVSPVRFGSGVKTKVGEALGAGLPVVGTTMGTEGFPACEGIVVRDDPDEFAAAVLDLENADVWRRRSVAGQDLVREAYGPPRCERELAEVLEYLRTARDAAA